MSNHQAALFVDHVQKNAQRYFPDLFPEGITVRLREKQMRPAAALYRFDIRDRTQSRAVIVKIPLRRLPRHPQRGMYEKPYLFRKVDSDEMHEFQYAALTSIYEYFAHLQDEQLGAIRVLDYLPAYHAIFMEESRDPKLQQLLMQESRLNFRTSKDHLTDAFKNAGKWLHKYHTMPKSEKVEIRDQHRDEYIEAVCKLTEFLAKAWGDASFFRQIASILTIQGREQLPEALPLGLGHGDYALRNILVGPNARITVLDTFAKWRTPIYEDLGYFLNGLHMSLPQIASQGFLFGSRQLMAYEHAFLKGYFETRIIPYPAIRLYEMLALLDKWSSVLMHYHRRSVKLRYFGRIKVSLTGRYFKKNTVSLINQIAGTERSSLFSILEKSYVDHANS